MKLFDIILITLAGLSLFLLAEDVAEALFKRSNSWIPDVFSDAVRWTPGATFYTVLSAALSGLFLVRFAPQPVLVAFLIGATIEVSDIYPLIQANGWQETLSVLTSSWQMAEKYLQALVLLPLVTFAIYFLRRPNREREVILDDNSRY